jgi:phosphonopyruvate decarboxylase
MIESKDFFESIKSLGIDFFTGVPDSLLKNICSYITDHTTSEDHIISSNEGSSMGLAIGYNLATGRIPLVYMQNSGFGNIVNPLASLADSDVYQIPMLLMIGWRGEPGVKDEPQHVKQGKITIGLLETIGIDYEILPTNIDEARDSLKRIVQKAKDNSCPCAIVIKKNTFADYKLKKIDKTDYEMDREAAIKEILANTKENDIIVSTTGKASREVFECRAENNQSHNKDFLTVGGMGHASQIALGIAMKKPNKRVLCIDGDGSVLMHMGGLGIIGEISPKNLVHMVINNGAHDSVGGQPTIGFQIDFSRIAKDLNYANTYQVKTKKELGLILNEIKVTDKGPVLIEVQVNKGARADLGRPTISPVNNKSNFMKFISQK